MKKVRFLLAVLLMIGLLVGCAGQMSARRPIIPQLPLRLSTPYWKAGIFLEYQCWAEVEFDKPIVVVDRVVLTKDAGVQLMFKEIKKFVLRPQQKKELVFRDLGKYYGTATFYRRGRQTQMPTKQGYATIFALKDKIGSKRFCIRLDGKQTREYRGSYYGDYIVLRP